MDATRYETRIAGPVQGFVQGEHNVVTLIFQGDERRTVPFLAPPRPLIASLAATSCCAS